MYASDLFVTQPYSGHSVDEIMHLVLKLGRSLVYRK